MRLVQLTQQGQRAVGIVDGRRLRILAGFTSVYALTMSATRERRPLTELAERADSGAAIDYGAVYRGDSKWRLLPPLDHPDDPARVLVSGTGLTHRVSAENRAAMHRRAAPTATDSMRMYQLGKEGGRPQPETVGAQPEWFYKGNGSVLRAHGEELWVPAYACDGGEEAEIAGAYVIADDGMPYRIGFMAGNEFSDHVMEKQNYLYLAHSKLRSCAVGPELAVGGTDLFQNVMGTAAIVRNGATVWSATVYSGETNMCHSLANLEHHHFKYEAHRRPGDVHIHFFGADAFSFGEGVKLEDGDWMEVGFPAMGRTLRNPIRITKQKEEIVQVGSVV